MKSNPQFRYCPLLCDLTAGRWGECIFFCAESTANTEWKLSASPQCGKSWGETTKSVKAKALQKYKWLKLDTHAGFIKVSQSSLHQIQYFAQLYLKRTTRLLHQCSLSLETPWRGYTGKPDYNSSSWSTLGPGPVEKLKATDPHPRKNAQSKAACQVQDPSWDL